MTTSQEHYDRHLGAIYTWMLGDIEQLMERNTANLRALGFDRPPDGALALDLGAGPGAFAIPLAKLGYDVVALDDCRSLVDELTAHAGALLLRAVMSKLEDFRQHADRPPHLILCMGDTLTHLPSFDAASRLLSDAAAALAPGGAFIATFRDYVSVELRGPQRFIPVRSSADRILTCFLEYSPTSVLVHDIVHELVSGQWQTRVSSYPKLRLDPTWVASQLEALGLEVTAGKEPNGMARIVGKKKEKNV
jgi:2-polyprenyl-3-methyl-5-hydroxy-6-metoxy-1,4-benzoquinol methylase